MFVLRFLSFLPVLFGAGITPLFAQTQDSEAIFIYLTSETPAAVAETYRAAERIEAAFDARIAANWEQVEAFHEEAPVAALIIDQSALAEAYQAWVENAYQQGIVIAGLNIAVDDLADLIGDACITDDRFAADTYPGDFFIIVSQLVLAENPSEGARVRRSSGAGCASAPVENITGMVSGLRSRATHSLDTPEDFQVFTAVLGNHVENISAAQDAFASTLP